MEPGRDLEQYIEYHPETKKHKCMLCKFLTNRPAKVIRQYVLPLGNMFILCHGRRFASLFEYSVFLMFSKKWLRFSQPSLGRYIVPFWVNCIWVRGFGSIVFFVADPDLALLLKKLWKYLLYFYGKPS